MSPTPERLKRMSTLTKEDLLTAYAAGTTSPGLSLLCAAHLALAPESRGFVGAVEEIGGALLADEPETGVAPMDFETLLARIDAEVDHDRKGAAGEQRGGLAPAPIESALGMPLEALSWKFRLPGISEHVLEAFEDEKVSLLKARPGRTVPSHTHSGLEATLVLQGALKDGNRVLQAGEISIAGPEDDHHPEIVGNETCYCLIVLDGALRFTGRFGRALNLFAE